jgi:hypothetical protein
MGNHETRFFPSADWGKTAISFRNPIHARLKLKSWICLDIEMYMALENIAAQHVKTLQGYLGAGVGCACHHCLLLMLVKHVE